MSFTKLQKAQSQDNSFDIVVLLDTYRHIYDVSIVSFSKKPYYQTAGRLKDRLPKVLAEIEAIAPKIVIVENPVTFNVVTERDINSWVSRGHTLPGGSKKFVCAKMSNGVGTLEETIEQCKTFLEAGLV